jgi:Fibronectin type III domain
VSEQPTATATRPPAAKAPGKKYAGLTRNQWIITGAVFAAALAYILWKRHQASTAAASTASTGATNSGSDECTDANGNPVDCDEEFAQELAALQNQLDTNQAGASGGGSGDTGTVGTTTGTGTTGTTGTTTTTGTATGTAPGTPTSTGGTTSTGTTTAPKTAGPISGLAASAVTKTSFKASWKAAANATGGYAWIVRDLASHTQTSAGSTKSTSVTVSGLKSGTDYNFGVQGLPGGVGDNIHVRTS